MAERILLLSIIAMLCVGCQGAEGLVPSQEPSAPRKDYLKEIRVADGEGRKPAIVFFFVFSDRLYPRIDLALWEDGRILWSGGSDASKEGGYCSSRVSAEKVHAILQQLNADGVFRASESKTGYTVPDAGFDAVIISTGTLQLCMRSVHEGFERNDNLVVTAHGVEPLEGRNRDQVLAAQPEDYKRFRAIWSEVKAGFRPLVPKGCPQMARVEEIDDPTKDYSICVRW